MRTGLCPFPSPNSACELTPKVIGPIIKETIASDTLIYADKYTFMDDWKNGSMRINRFAIAKANMPEMRIKMDFMKCMSIPWKVFGPCSALSCNLIGGSHRINFHFIWAFSNSFTT